MGIYKLPKNQWTKDGRKYKYYWNEKDKSGKWKKKFSQAYKTKLDAMNAEREFLNNKVEFGGDMDMTFGTLSLQISEQIFYFFALEEFETAENFMRYSVLNQLFFERTGKRVQPH